MLHKFIVYSIFILSTKIFNYNSLSGTTQRGLLYLLFFIMMVTIIRKETLLDKSLTFRKPILIMFSCMLLSSIPCKIYFDQSFSDSLIALGFFVLPFLFYFYLHSIKIKEKQLIRLFFWMSVIAVSIQIIQQLYPQLAVFGIHQDDGIDSFGVRNDLYRFRVNFNGIFTFPILFLFWTQILKRFSLNRFLFVLLFLASIYLALTRSVYVTVALCMAISIVLFRKTIKFIYVFLAFLVLGIIAYSSFDTLFSALIEKSQNEIDNEDYIRYLSYEYFFDESKKTPLNFLFGHCVPRGGSAYDAFIRDLGESSHFYSSDVGCVGAAYRFGYIYVALFYLIQFVCIFKYKQNAPQYVILTIIAITIYSVMIFMISIPIGALVWTSMLYIIDLYKYQSPQRYIHQ